MSQGLPAESGHHGGGAGWVQGSVESVGLSTEAWFVDESMSQGLLFACQQGQVDMGAVLGECRGVLKA